MPSRSWLVCRVVLALVLLVSFYLLAFGVAAGLLWIAYADLVYTRHPALRLVAFCVAGGLSVLWAIVPRRDRFEPPGPRLDPASEPQLFASLAEIAAATAQPMPAEVYLVNDVNAFVTQRGGIMGLGSRRVMGLGLPLMHAVTVQEFKAILAHEFGHYHSGDVALGPWIHKTRAAIGRAIEQLSDNILQKIFVAYGVLFLRVTHAVSRRQEFIADEVAAQAVGGGAMISGLRKAHAATLAFQSYWNTELSPVMGSGYLPPVNLGFARFLQVAHVVTSLDAAVQQEEAEGRTGPYDTHPSLGERIAYLNALPPGSSGDSLPAASLFRDLPKWERQVIESVSADLAALRRVEWEQVAAIVYVPMWRQQVAKHGHALRNITMSTIPASFAGLGSSLFDRDESPTDEERIGRAWHLTIAATSLALVSAGWTAEAFPGDEIVLRRDGHEFRPFSELTAVMDGRLTSDQWRERCVALDIADLPLVTADAADMEAPTKSSTVTAG